MRKTKTKLITTLSIALLSVFTMGVSTFAWFQANADVHVQATETSTEITVNKPDDYTFYAYNGNGSSSYTPKEVFHDAEDESDGDFTVVTPSNKTAKTSYSGTKPGTRLFYCVKIDNPNSLNLKITKLISNNAEKQNITYVSEEVTYIQHRYTYLNSTDVEINVGWSIDIYCVAYYDDESYLDFVTDPATVDDDEDGEPDLDDLFKFNQDSTAAKRAIIDAGSYASQEITLAEANQITLYNNGSISEDEVYLFFCVIFSNDSGTYYNEIDGSTKTSGTPTVLDVPVSNGNRYFKKAPGGNSNCFAGLKFALTELKLTIG